MKKGRVKNFVLKLWKDWRLTIFFIVFVIIPVKSSLADWNWVPTGSMKPSIFEGDLVFVNKVAYGLRFPLTQYRLAQWADPERGDVVICFSPEDRTRLVKRVIGLPGDTIEMRNNILFLNGYPVKYTKIDPRSIEYVPANERGRSRFATEDLRTKSHAVMSVPSVFARRSFDPIVVAKGSYFVLGDNRDNSRDSRYFGFVQRQAIIGRVPAVIASFDITDKYQPRLKRFFSSLK